MEISLIRHGRTTHWGFTTYTFVSEADSPEKSSRHFKKEEGIK